MNNPFANLMPIEGKVDWQQIYGLTSHFDRLDETPQDPRYHGEGDVGTHTRMVVQALIEDEGWQALDDYARKVLFWTACFHDIGKPATTVHEEDGAITSKGHSRVGAEITREVLWRLGADFHFREAVCGLIMSHQLPFWLIERDDPNWLAVKTSFTCNPDWLITHAKADLLGRVCADQDDVLTRIALAREVFAEMKCLDAPREFTNDASRLHYLNADEPFADYVAFEDFGSHVTLLSGLPGSGKDHYLEKHLAHLPVISLDAFRREMKISPRGNQGRVVQAAIQMAKEYLREGKDFVWNATNTTAQIRARLLSLFHDYKAHTKIVYIEVPMADLKSQNRDREHVVPWPVIEKLATRLEPPTLLEAHEVQYVVS